MVRSTMSTTQFTKDGKYFAQISTDGKIKIWETATSTFKQEFTPNFHLTTPCCCLQWIQSGVQSPWKKRKKRQYDSSSAEFLNYFLALGTTSGSLLLYSFASAQVDLTIDSNTSHPVSCLSSEEAQEVYAGVEQFILLFDLKEKSVKTKWKSGTEKIKSILVLPKNRLLTASRTINLWDLKSKEIIKKFTGHNSDVSMLNFIPTNTESYFLSGSKSDRILNCWSLSENSQEKNSVASLLMQDVAFSVSLQNFENSTNLAAVTRNGNLHIFQITLNGKCAKPVKPKVTIQIAAEQNDVVTPISIIGAFCHADASVMIAHGNNVLLTFENVVPNSSEKVQCLIRKDPRQILTSKANEIKKSKQVKVDETSEYLTPHTQGNLRLKRKLSEKTEVPMEQRLENLTLNKLTTIPRQDNLANLLMQGLHSKDKSILKSVLCKRDEIMIKNTLRRLPMQVITPLLAELSNLVRGKTLASETGVIWLKYLIQLHAGQLLSNPELVDNIQPILASIEDRLSLLTPLSRLRGRLDLLVSQISDSNNKEETEEAVLVYKEVSSDSENEENIEFNLHSESENEWVENENDDSNSNNEEDIVEENNISDSEMSM